jgi:hypothetical protein
MWGKSIRKFIDELDINSSVYFVLLFILGIAIFTTVCVNHKLKVGHETEFVNEKGNPSQNTAMFLQ